MNTRTHLLICALAGLPLVLPAVFAGAGPLPAAPPLASAPADTPAVSVVRQFLAARTVGLPDAAYALLSASSQQAISAEDFAAGPFPSQAAEVLNASSHLSTPTAGFLALLADPHQALGYTFAVIGPDPAVPSVVLLRATPPVGAVKLPTVSAPETGVRHAVTLRLLIVIDPKIHAPRIDAVKSLEQAAAPGEMDEEREQERKFVSLSHLGQLSVGILRYTNEHHEVMPDADHWADEIMPYVKDPDAFRDPSGPVGPAGEEWSYRTVWTANNQSGQAQTKEGQAQTKEGQVRTRRAGTGACPYGCVRCVLTHSHSPCHTCVIMNPPPAQTTPDKVTQPDEILTILARDARMSPETIATLTGRGVSEVRAAIADYERRGIIKHYKTIIDWEKAGVEKVFAFIDVKVLPAREVGFDAVAERLYRYPEVHSVWLVSGGSDLRVVVEGKHMREVGRFVAEKLSVLEGVTATDTHFLLRRYKEDQDLFVEVEGDQRLVVSP